jgi:inhibitor of KinA
MPWRAVKRDFRVVMAGDSAMVVEFDERIDAAVNARAVRLAEAIESMRITGLRDVVPTYRSVAVYFDPLRTDAGALLVHLERSAGEARAARKASRTPIRIPVCYGGRFGPDLQDVARASGFTESEVVARHTAPTYRVYMLGFLPGFAYMGTVDPKIVAPRRPTPRVRVPAGSVGIAGAQTGIYPSDSPGGWQLLGRTPFQAFALERSEPFLLKAGDAVQFYSIAKWPS